MDRVGFSCSIVRVFYRNREINVCLLRIKTASYYYLYFFYLLYIQLLFIGQQAV